MNCKGCGYALWNLKARVCPECGSPFAPSEFEFSLNSVQFRCPHCAQAYYGTGERGHLVPVEFGCVKCARHIHMDEMLLLPTAGVTEEQTSVERSPWLERQGLGIVPWLKTIGWAMFQPRRLMRATPPESSTWAAVGFAVMSNGLYIGVWLVTFIGFFMIMSVMGGGGAMFMAGGGLVAGCLMLFAMLAGFAFVWALAAHGLLVLTGKAEGGLGRTVQVICYSSAANAVLMVPCLGMHIGIVGGLWWVVCATVMAVEAHKVVAGRAVLAFGVPPVLLIAALVVGLVLWVMAISTTMTTMGTIVTTTPGGSTVAWPPAVAAESRPGETRAMLDALLAHGREHEGRPPDHAARLVFDGRLDVMAFVAGGSGLSMAGVTVDGFPVAALSGVTGDGRDALERVAAALPAGTVAYRVGDFVFTYPGIDLASGDPGLWVVVCAPDQAAPWATRTPGTAVQVGRLGGTVTPIASTALPDALEEQNLLRASFGLGPLPDPALVREGEPAVRGE